MPSIFDKLGKVEPCDGRDLLQKLTYVLITEIAEKKAKICAEFEQIFQDFGLENFSPCNVIDTSILSDLKQGNTLNAINRILITQNLPPHTFQIIRNGYQSLSDREKRDVQNYLTKNVSNYLISEIEPILQKKIQELIKCPTPARAETLITRLENITKTLTKLQATLNYLSSYVNTTSAVVSAINAAMQATKKVLVGLDVSILVQAALPVGTAGLTARIISRTQRFIDRNEDDIQRIDTTLCGAARGLEYAAVSISTLLTFTQIADSLLQTCLIDSPDLSTSIRNLTPTSFTPTDRRPEYRGYELEIRTSPEQAVAPLRYAVALDPVGVVVLSGPKSFSSSTEVLLEELKFRIDNQLG